MSKKISVERAPDRAAKEARFTKNRAIPQSIAVSPCLKGLNLSAGMHYFKDLFGADAFGLEHKIPVLVYAYGDELAGEHPAG